MSMSAFSTTSTSSSPSAAPPPPLPSWMTDEASTVDTLLAEIARQAPSMTTGSTLSPSKTTVPESDPDHPDNRIFDAAADHDDAHSFVPTTAIQPLAKLIRSPVVLRRFLHKFVIARSGRYASAAERVLNLVKVLEQYPHLTITYDRDIIHCLMLDVFECFPLKQCERLQGAVNMFLRFRNLDWDKVTSEQMEKTMFWLMFIAIMMPNHAAQIHGMAFQVDGEDCGPSNIKMAFEMFCLRLMSQCLPMRMIQMVTYNAPRFIRWFVYPPMKLAIPEKIRDRIFWVDDHEEIEKRFGTADLHHAFGGPWRPNGSPSGGDLAFVQQWTTDGRISFPDEIVERMEQFERGVDRRDQASAGVDKRTFY